MAALQTHTYQDISLNLGETWTIIGTLNKNSAPLPVDQNSIVQWRLVNPNKGLIMLVSLAGPLVITDYTKAAYQIVIQPSQQQSTVNLTAGLFRYELSVKLSDGTVSIQAEGSVTINSSLTYRFPNS